MTGFDLRVLVTGGAGYVGSHVAKRLARSGWQVTTFDNLQRGHREAVRWGPLVVGDLRDREALQRLFAANRFDAVVHMAALAYVGESMAHPLEYYDNNVRGSLNLVEAMLKHGVDTLVFSSTCAVYGVHDEPITEASSKRPISPYGRSKLAVERLLGDSVHAYGMRIMSLRYFNAAGADPDGELRELHDPEPHLVPNALAAAQAVMRDGAHAVGATLDVYGADFDTPDGTAIRDYIHVSDLAAAHGQAVEHLRALREPEYVALNLGTGRGCSVLEVVSTCEHVTGVSIRVRMAPRRGGDPPRLVADSGLARARLGWEPAHPELESMVRTAWRVRDGVVEPADVPSPHD